MGGILGDVDGWIDEVAVGIVICTTDNKFKVLIGFGVIYSFGKFVERGFVNDGTDEVSEGGLSTNFQRLRFGDKRRFDSWPEGRSDVGTGRCTTFLTLIFKCTANSIHDSVVDVCAWVDKVEILATCFTNNAGIAAVLSFCNPRAYSAVKTAENSSTPREMQAREISVSEDNTSDFLGVAGDKLYNIGRKTGFLENFVYNIV